MPHAALLRSNGPTRWLVVGNLVVAMLLASLAAVALVTSRRAYADKAQDATESMANGLRQMLGAEIRHIDMALLHVRSAWLRRPGDHEIETLLADQLPLIPWVDSVRIAGADGIVRHGPGVEGSAVDLSDRDFFRKAKAGAGDELLFSEPLEARISRKWVVVMARRLQRADGSFDGVVYANVPVDAFRQRFAEVDVGPSGAITLRTASRQLVARHAPGVAEAPAIGSTKVSQELDAALAQRPRAGFFVSTTVLDGVERMSAYQAVDRYPFVVLVGLSTSDYFKAWRRQAGQIGILFGASLLTLFGASHLVLRARRRERESAQLLMTQGLRNRALLRAASDGVQVMDRNGLVREASDSLAQMLGCEREALLGQHVGGWDVRFSADHITAWLKALPNGELRRFESRYRRRDGAILDVEVQAAAAVIDGEDYVYCSVRDVSERKRMGQQLVEASNEIRDLYENAPCLYYSLDREGRIVRMNETGLQWLGCTREEVIGCSPREFLNEEGRAQFKSLFPRFLAEGHIGDVEFDLVPRRGETRRVRMSSVAVRDAQGEFVMSRSVLHDITQLERAQQVRLKAAELEAENRQLREANRVKRAFLSNVSHEMRTPLNAVLGFAQLLRTGAIEPQSPRFGHLLDHIDDSGTKLLRLIDSVLQIAHAESTRLEFSPEPTDVRRAVATVLSMFEAVLKDKAIVVETDVAPAAATATLDPLRLEQALAAYVSNAVKFTGRGGRIAVRAWVPEAAVLRVEVADSGIGIRAEDMGRLFVDFQQLSEGHTKAFEGLGIGLALTKRIVEAQGGTVSVRSRIGQGSTFAFELPGVVGVAPSP